MTEMSRSPYKVSASDLGIGVNVGLVCATDGHQVRGIAQTEEQGLHGRGMLAGYETKGRSQLTGRPCGLWHQGPDEGSMRGC